ncbi:MAG: hypothetical protein QM589_12390 [Thermomicrobiales bacterium]
MPQPRKPADRIVIAERRRRVADLVRRGLRQTDIAAQLQVDVSTVSRDIRAIEAGLRQRAIVDVAADRSLQRERLDQAINAIWPQVLVGDAAAVRNPVRLVDRIAKLDGLDMPARVEAAIDSTELIRRWAIRDGHDPAAVLDFVDQQLKSEGIDPR